MSRDGTAEEPGGRSEARDSAAGSAASAFDEHRRYLFAIAYRMLGSAADAEDMVQEAFLRWDGARDVAVESPRAYLAAVVTRLCIDHLRSARVRRETYVGPWLPEPLISGAFPSADEGAELDESLSIAFLVLLESLGPVERAAFVLREVFDYEYSEIAGVIDKSEQACRQIVKRARERVAERRPRFETSRRRREEFAQSFALACKTGDMAALLGVLASDITLTSDGGGKVAAAIKPVYGADRVARFLLGLISKPAAADLSFEVAEVNGEPGFVVRAGGKVANVLVLHVGPAGIEEIFIVRNPDKLGGLR